MASVTFNVIPSSLAVCPGDAFTVQVSADVSGAAINAAQGELTYDADTLTVTGIQHGTSFMTFWVMPPAVPQEPGTIPFIGGLPTPGFIGKNGTIMTVTFRAEREDTASAMMLGDDTIALMDDGLATEATVLVRGGTVTVLTPTSEQCVGAEPATVPVTDTEPPLPFEIEITRTENAFGGDYFASYHTTDAESGVAYYEVMESSPYHTYAWTEHPSPYGLVTQGGEVQLSVRAIDNAGNVRTEMVSRTLEAKAQHMNGGDLVLLMVAGALAVLILWHCWHQRKRGE